MLKAIVFLSITTCLILGSTGCGNTTQPKTSIGTYTLSGYIKGLDSGWAYIKHRETQIPKIDSAPVKNGHVVFSGHVVSPEFCNFGLCSNGVKDYFFGFFLQNGRLVLTCNKDSLNDSAIRFDGSEVEDEFRAFQKRARPIDLAGYNLQRSYDCAKAANDRQKLDSIGKLYARLDQEKKRLVLEQSTKHPSSFVTAFEASSYLADKNDIPRLTEIFNAMDTAIRHSYFGKKIAERLKENTAKQ